MSLIEKLDGLVKQWRGIAHEYRYNPAAMPRTAHHYETCADELDALMPAIRQAMVDAERLDWLDAGGTVPVNNYRFAEARGTVAWSVGRGRTARQAIDKARATGEGEGHE